MKATIAKSSPRYSTWMDVFGTDTIRILEPPKPGPKGDLRILVDVTALNPQQVQRLALKFGRAWRIPVDRMAKEMAASGSVPISAEGATVVEEARLF